MKNINQRNFYTNETRGSRCVLLLVNFVSRSQGHAGHVDHIVFFGGILFLGHSYTKLGHVCDPGD